MKIAFIRFLSSKDKWSELFETEYQKKINYLFPFEYYLLKSKAFSQAQREDKKARRVYNSFQTS